MSPMAQAPQRKNVVLEDQRIMFRNFAGAKRQYNEEGKRNFVLFLDDVTAEGMAADGYNVKHLKLREDADPGDTPQAYLQVNVNFKGRPPRIVLVTSRNKTQLDESTAEMVDYADIASADVIIRPYEWSVNGNTGITAYLQSIYVNINESELDLKYADIEDATISGVRPQGFQDPEEPF